MKTSRIVLGCILAAFVLLTGSAGAQVITEFSAGITAGAGLGGITAGPDGSLWFTEGNIDRIGRITPQGVVTEFSAGISAGARPAAITAGPDGNLWFTEPGAGQIGRITPAGVVTEFSAGISAGANPTGIAAGPDGNLWFTEVAVGGIGRITPLGIVTEFPVTLTRNHHIGAAITAGPDGNLWFTVSTCLLCSAGPPWIGRITPLGVITGFSVGFFPGGITAGPDGNLWISTLISRIARMTPAGVVTQFSAGITSGNSLPSITAGPDGHLWFTERPFSTLSGASRIGRINPLTGTVAEFSAGLSANAYPSGITAGPDGNLWFTEPGVNRIGRITACLNEAACSAAKTTVVSSVNPSRLGQAVTFTASVAGNFASGTVQFMDGEANLGPPVTLSGGGIAQLVISTLARGTHAITAVYSGDGNNAPGASPVLSQVVKSRKGGGH